MPDPIAIVGVGCRFPGGASSPSDFWRLLVDGVDAITELPPARFDLAEIYDPDPRAPGRMYTRWGGFVTGIDQFDPSFFGFSHREAMRIDPQHRMLLEVAWEALEDAGLPADRLAGSNTGVFIGISTHDYPDFQSQPLNRHLIDAHTNSGGAGSIAANRISYVYDLRGPSLIVDTACSSSLVAVHLACQSLRAGECDLALAGGVQAVITPELTIGFCKASMISPDGRCKAFAAEANGYVRGEGAGLIVLKPLARALADGDPIHAVVRGSAINEDGRTNGMTVPGLRAQQEVLREAYRRAGVRPGDVTYVEAHGPGTPVGDPIEAEALATVLASDRPPGEVLRIGSVKTNIGHLEAASGIAGLIKAALVLEHGRIPPSLHFRTPNPAIPFDAYRLRVVSEGETWPAGAPALAGINSFGFGGANAHVVLEGPPAAEPALAPPAPAVAGATLLVVSTRSPESLRALARAYHGLARATDAPDPADLAAAAARHRSHLEHRLAVVGRDRETLADNLDAFVNQESRADVAAGRVVHGRPPRVALVFAGMGPQWWGMGRQLLEREPVFRGVIEQCDRLIRRHATWSLLEELLADEAHSRVAEADFAQPVNFAFQAALLALWRSWGLVPAAVVGHSAGEIAAVYAAGALDLDEAVRVAFHRGRLQHRASGKGRMLAVGLGLGAVQPVVEGYAGRVSIAAVNSPASVTLSGDADAIAEINARFESSGAFSRVMSVQVPYHSHHMDPIEGDLLEALAGLDLRPAVVPIVSEVTGDWANDVRFDAAYWWRNIRQPVLFGAAIDRLIADGYDTFLELSPHPVLAASVNECLAGAGQAGVCLASLRRNDDDRAMLLRSLAQLYVRGAAVDWEAVLGRPRARVALPLNPWNRERVWLDGLTAAPPADAAADGRDTRILGRRVRAVQPHWEVNLASPALEYVKDHRIHGAVVYPGAAYVAMALEAAADLTGATAIGLEDVEFRKALFMPDSGALRLQTVYDPGPRTLHVHAEHGQNGLADSWSLHAICRLGAAGTDGAVADLDAIRRRCPREITRDEFYRDLSNRGFTFGPRFMNIERLAQGDGEAFGRVRLGGEHAAEINGDHVHPVLFDAGLQVLISAALSREQIRDHPGVAFLPTRAARVTAYRPVGDACWSHAVVTGVTPEGFEGTVSLHDDEGRLLLRVEGLQAKSLEGARAGDVAARDYAYRLIWEEQARPGDALTNDAPVWCDPPAAAAAVNARADALAHDLGFAGYYADVEPSLERLARAFFASAFDALGTTLRPGVAVSTAVLPDGTPLSGTRQRLVEAMASSLAEAGLLGPTGPDSYRVLRAPDSADEPIALADALRRDRPSWTSVVDVIERCGRGLAEVVAGRTGAPEILFSRDGLELMRTFYREAPTCRLFNTLTAETIAEAAARFPADRPLRVLEVGGGTGGTTLEVLARLSDRPLAFTFTDVSPLFVNLARTELGDTGSIRFGVLDLERDAKPQGFEAGSYDVVVAANVVHATADVARTLARMRSLVAPGGALVLQEITRRPRWLDLVFGLNDGWWAFAGDDLRPSHALLDVPMWRRALDEAGFDSAAAVHEHEADAPGQSVLVATVPAATSAVVSAAGGTTKAIGAWLVLADRRGVGARLADALAARGRAAVLAYVGGEELSLRNDGAWEVPAASVEAMRKLIAEIEAAHAGLAGIAHLWSLDMPSAGPDVDVNTFLDAQRLGYGSLLSLLHAVDPAGRRTLERVVLVTGGAAAPEGGGAVDLAGEGLLQTPLWGVGRILLHEHPELRPLLVDCSLDPGDAEIAALAREAVSIEREDEIALRGTHRFVRRLVRLDLDEPIDNAIRHEPANGRPYQADVRGPGTIDAVTLREMTRRPPGRGEVEIEVRAASLNFRDVAFALGLLPPEAFENSMSRGAIGVDCAGVVTAVGEDVTDVRPGDEVMAIAASSLATHAITERLVVRKPAGLSFAEAAGIPLAYVTAIYALETMARLRAGERVLIHAGTGGVGLAAIAVAKRTGAEIFATAGTDAKRDYLRSLGVQHVMNSRTLDFAAEIMAATAGRGVDVVLNSIAGEAIAKSLSVLAPQGRFVEIGKADIYRSGDLPLEAFRRNLSYFAVQIDSLCDYDRPALRAALDATLRGIEEGSLPVLPTEVHPIGQLEQAMRTLAQARHIGKLVVSVDDPNVPIEPLSSGEAPLFRPDASYMITGGRGGVGAALAVWAAARGARRLVLAGRRASADEQAPDVAALRAAGVDVVLVDADVGRTDDAARVVAVADTTAAPLRGIFHGAMVIDDASLVDLTWERFASVMSPKAGGAWNLHRLTHDRALDHFVMFSSITSVYGNARQANYGAANAFLDALAGWRHAHGLPATTINWGVFSDAGYVAARRDVAEYLTRQGQFGLPAADGFAAMADVMRRGVPQATISRTDWTIWAEANPVMGSSPRFRDLVRPREPVKSSVATDRGAPRVLETLLAADADGRRKGVSDHLRSRVARILGSSPDRIEPDVSLTEMGMDSLMAVELMTAVKTDFSLDVPAVKLLQGVTVDQLTTRVLEHIGAGPSAPASLGEVGRQSAPADTGDQIVSGPDITPIASRTNGRSPAALATSNGRPATAPNLDAPAWTPFQRLARALVTGFVRGVADVRIEGEEHVPRAGPVLIAANHVSMWDAPVLLCLARRRTVMFAAEELRHYPWLHWTLHSIWDSIYLRRGEGDTKALEEALAVLHTGAMLGVAPEGIRSPEGLRRGLTGAAHLSQRSGAPVLPVAIFGQERIPAAASRFRRAPVRVRISPPLPAFAGEPTAQALREWTDRLMIEIACLLPPEYRGAYAAPAADREAHNGARSGLA